MRRVIINADDLGICEGTNVSISRAHREGVLTSASLMANGAAFDHAVETVVGPNPELGIGLHLCLTSGVSVLSQDRLKDLVGDDGHFRYGFVSLARAARSATPEFLQQVEAELDAQFQRVCDAGVHIDHVDGHRYFHVIPGVFEIVARLALKHDCQVLRYPRERLGPWGLWTRPGQAQRRLLNVPKQIILSRFTRAAQAHQPRPEGTEHFHGVLDSGAVTSQSLLRLLSNLPAGTIEIVTHPGGVRDTGAATCTADDLKFLQSPDRLLEFEALVDPGIKSFVEQNGIQLQRFADLATEDCAVPAAKCSGSLP
ncbi:hypothetical protein Pan258_04500 [Symmachiella dynata]|uniref:carbohydrate deacetylase n=1 Tax=Symmachiella dynata TaxID=2527995 RepID=UPI00118A5541|nr:ChbG/HpnK family deacetylase [Symmachiella dynata]QDT46431.1 hypothetical protein Pan258_04500 [Symmachiella dynata]